MSSDITAKLQRMGRRRFLGTLAGMGVSGAAVTHLSRDAVAEVDLDEEVPRLGKLHHTNHEEVIQGKPPEREPIHYTISRDKWAVVETAHDAASQVTKQLESAGFEAGVRAGVTTVTRNNHDQKAVIVKRTVGETADGQAITPGVSEDELKDALPATVSGTAGDGKYQQTIENIPVEIETERVARSPPTAQPTPDVTGPGDQYEHKYRPVPGGACIQWGTAFPGSCGTSCAPAYNEDAEQYDLVTAGHVTKSKKIHQPKDDLRNNHQIGTRIDDKDKVDHPPQRAPPSFDAGVVSLSVDHTHMFAADDGDNSYLDDHHVFGVVGVDKLKDNENSDFEILRRGTESGMKEGTLGDVYEDDDAFDADTDGKPGDSGGPHYTREYDPNFRIWKVYIAGVCY
ncbi:MAG: hypothetical protein J07HR59_01570, partial [Halorubrum sp. J07HR59]